jgi:hypothetical protein
VETSQPVAQIAGHQEGMLRAAFRDVHGPSLHGFALLLTLGDREEAARLSSVALAEGARRAATLRHPERAAAWLRRRVIQTHGGRLRPEVPLEERLAALAAIGVDEGAYEALAALRLADRAALVAGEIERLDPMDLELVLGVGPSRVRPRVWQARTRFLERRMAAVSTGTEALGPVGKRIIEIANRTLASPSS